MEQIKDTKDIQIKSVVNFMDVLGYSYDPDMIGGFIRKDYWEVQTANQVVRFNTAVRLHNNPWLYLLDSETFPVDPYIFNRALASKIVTKAKLQCTKHGVIKVQEHKVEFMDDYYDLFLGGEK